MDAALADDDEAAHRSGAGSGAGEDESAALVGGEQQRAAGGEPVSLRRHLTRLDALSVEVGIIVGSGIFASPGVVLSETGAVGLALVAWCAAALLAAGSALGYAELGAALPRAGGDYEYLKMAFGERVAFAWVFSMFWVIKSGSQAILSLTFASYACSSVGLPTEGPTAHLVAAVLVAVLTAVNCAGVAAGSKLQNVLTVAKLALVAAIVVLAVAHRFADPADVQHNLSGGLFEGSRPGGLATAVVAALWAFDGWNDVTFMAEEMREPAKDLPTVIIGGLVVVLVAYLSVNVGYIAILGPADVKTSHVVARDCVDRLLGPHAAAASAALVALSVAGAANGSVMTGGRYLYAAARDGQAPAFLARLGGSSRAPYTALATQGAWALVLLASGADFGKLLAYFGASSWMFYSATSLSVVYLRERRPDLARPFLCPGYPYVPLAVVVVGIALVADATRADPVPCTLALCFCALGVPAHALFLHGRGKPTGAEPPADCEEASAGAL